jgi:protein ImuB
MKRAVCIWLPDWPLQRLMLTRPELKGQAVVLHETQRGTERVVACSARAVALGVTVGMPLAEASAACGLAAREKGKRRREKREEGGAKRQSQSLVVDAKPQAAFPRPSPLTPRPSPLAPRPSDPLADLRALESLAEWSARFSPIVGLENSTTPESLLLDVTGLAHLFGGEASLAERIVHDFARRGLTVRLSVADTIGAAWAMAHSAFSIQHSAFSIQHSAFSTQHSAFVLVPPGEVLPALRPLPVAALRLPAETVGLLRQLGIDRIGQLEALPREELSSRFGPELLRRWDQAIGRLAEPVPMHGQPPQFEADCSLEHPTIRRETIDAVLEQLIGHLAQMLLELGRGAMRLECRLACISAGPARTEPVQLSVGLFRPTAAAGHLCSLVQMQLERLRLPGPLAGVHVSAVATAPLSEEQQALFSLGDGLSQQHDRYLAELVERLSSRLGHRSVLRVRLVADAQPELAWRYDPLIENARRRSSPKQVATELRPRPLRLLRRPMALHVTSLIPDGPPARFQFCGRDQRIAQHWGPERIETGWWRNRTVGRDYYHVETTTGHRYWLFRRLRDGRWFLHGTFE